MAESKAQNHLDTMEIPGTGTLRTAKMCYRKGAVDERVILNQSFQNDIYLPRLPEYRVGPDHVVVDIGAYIGTFSLLMASLAPQGKVFAIEPAHDSFRILQTNVALNELKNIFVFNIGLADRKGYATLFHNLATGPWGHTIQKALSSESEVVETDTLSNFMHDNNILSCDLMKSNCEGAEFQIFLSTPREVLQRIKLLVILYHGDFVEQHSETKLARHLENAGFSVRIRNTRRGRQRGWIVAENKTYYLQVPLRNTRIKLMLLKYKARVWVRSAASRVKRYLNNKDEG